MRPDINARYPAPTEPAPGCTCYLPFIAGTGQKAHDVSKEGNDWSITGGSWLTSQTQWDDRLGYGISLDGNSDYISIAGGSSIETSEMTVRLRFKYAGWDNGSNEMLINEPSDNGVPIYIRVKGDGTLNAYLGTNNASWDVSNLDPDRIYELTLSLGTDRYDVYLDGSGYHAGSGGSITHSTNPIYIGQRGQDNEYADMEVFSVETYDRALTNAEVKGHHMVARSMMGAVEGQTRWFDGAWSERANVNPESGTRKLPLLSSPPSNPEAGDYYLDDGTNTSSGSVAVRIYDGGKWIDQN